MQGKFTRSLLATPILAVELAAVCIPRSFPVQTGDQQVRDVAREARQQSTLQC